MIPDFDEHGNLPPGTYAVRLSEVIKRFGSGSPKRHLLTKRLREFLVWLEGIAVGVYIDGSYVTRKLAPGDVDLALLLPQTL